MAKGFDAPPTLERSGSEHRRAVTSPLPEEEGLGEKVELSLQERRRGRKFSTVGRLHPSRLRRVSVPCEGNRKGRKAYCGLVRMWSSFWQKGDGGIRKTFFNGKKWCQWVQWKLVFKLPSAARFINKEGWDDFRKTSFWLKGDGGIRKNLL